MHGLKVISFDERGIGPPTKAASLVSFFAFSMRCEFKRKVFPVL